MRIGFAIGRPELHAAMSKLKTPFNTSGVAQAAALAAIDDREHVARCIATNASERQRLSDGLTQLRLRPVPSETNFIFMEVGPEAKEICDELLQSRSDCAAARVDGVSGGDPHIGRDDGRKWQVPRGDGETLWLSEREKASWRRDESVVTRRHDGRG